MINDPINPVQKSEYQSPFKGWHVGLLLFVLLILYSFGFAVGGELGAIMQASLETVPFAILAILAYSGLRQSGGKIMAVIWMFGLIGLIALLTLVNSFLALQVDPSAMQRGQTPEFVEGGLLRMGLVFLGLGIAVVIGSVGFFPAVRRWLSQFLPLDPDNFVHTIALVTVVSLTLVATVPLVFLGEPPLLTIISGFEGGDQTFIGRDNAGLQRDQIYRLLWLIPSVIFAVAYGLRRNLRQSLERLGMVRPTLKQVLFGIGLAVVLVFAVLGLEWGIGAIWNLAGWPRTDNEAFGLILEFAFTPIGAVILGVTAGLGEELAVRGVLQPRMGILLSNMLFTALHALQYNWDGMIIVFAIGLLFGVIRKYSNTTTCAIIHGLYDFMIVMAVVLSIPGFDS